MSLRAAVLVVGLALVGAAWLTGCGRRSKPDFLTLTERVTGDASVEGYVTDTGFVVQGQRPLTGDDEFNQVARAFYRFPHPALPAGAEIVRAAFTVGQEGGAGTPYTDLGNVVLEHVLIGPDLDTGDFDAPTLAADAVVLSTDFTLGAKSADITALVLADLAAGRDRTDLRLRFETPSDTDTTGDFAIWNDAAGTGLSGVVPVVVVTVRVPVP